MVVMLTRVTLTRSPVNMSLVTEPPVVTWRRFFAPCCWLSKRYDDSEITLDLSHRLVASNRLHDFLINIATIADGSEPSRIQMFCKKALGSVR
jgi:hypothetical protein